ncbi:BQ5605_C050g12503 [Microbotryum silenes-dioicae]|uniref:BQ5605_C050g12503 protein n=1 Tax=Microbotryum silenes-dioicae TaxID=796604 RepID=A0A2X0PHC5_9BASI|nr:BQ5605_C050g12503 [Microbotryum silenes-dioicae]
MTARQLAALRELAALVEVGVAPSPPPPTSIRVIPTPWLTRRRFSLALSFPPELVELIGHALIGKDPKMIQSTHYGDLRRSSLIVVLRDHHQLKAFVRLGLTHRYRTPQLSLELEQENMTAKERRRMRRHPDESDESTASLCKTLMRTAQGVVSLSIGACDFELDQESIDNLKGTLFVVLPERCRNKLFVLRQLLPRTIHPIKIDVQNFRLSSSCTVRSAPDFQPREWPNIRTFHVDGTDPTVALAVVNSYGMPGLSQVSLYPKPEQFQETEIAKFFFGFFNTYGGILAHMVLILKLTATQFAKLINYIPATVQIQQLTLQYSVTTRTAAIEAADQAMKMIRAPCLDDLWYLGVQQEKQNLFGQQVEVGGVMFFASFGQREEVPPFDIEVYWEPLKQFCRDNKILFRFNLESW